MKPAKSPPKLPPRQSEELLGVWQARFGKNPQRHPGLAWSRVRARLEARPEKLRALGAMERTGGEPDVVGHDERSGEVMFMDCAAQSPAARASLCYDRAALDGRKNSRRRAAPPRPPTPAPMRAAFWMLWATVCAPAAVV